MGSTNFTTHYDIPLPLGSDKTTPMDYNESMQTIDTALFEAHGNAASAVAGLEITNGNVAQNADNIDALEERMTTAEGTLVTQGNAITNLGLDVADVRADAQDMICAYKEADAQADHAYSIGDFFIYNDVLYKATEAIAIGDTIVPDTNCTTDNVTTEIKALKNDLTDLHPDTLYTGSVSANSEITLSNHINNYRFVQVIINDLEGEGTLLINSRYGDLTSRGIQLITTVAAYNGEVSPTAMAIADLALTNEDGVHYTCVRSAQTNLTTSGVSYMSGSQTFNISIYGCW